jgi:uncharacterized protein
MNRWAEWLHKYRVAAALLVLLATVLLAFNLKNLDVSTKFLDLYPSNDQNVKLFKQYPKFGTPLTVTLLIKVKHGNIYNYATLEKIKEATKMFAFIPGVDNDGIVSIASTKVKHVEATPFGFTSKYLMVGYVPETPQQLAKFRKELRDTPGVIGNLVSTREDAAIVRATFIGRLVNYDQIFNGVNRIVRKLGDKNHEVYATGEPILTGWVYHYQHKVYEIFGIGFLLMVALLALYFRNLEGIVIPSVVGIVSGIWGFGFAAVLGINLDPLIIVVPVLLIARALSHSVQMCERYFELYNEVRDTRHACIESLVALFPPGAVGIICDASGIFLIAVAPIPLIQKVAYVCGVWSLTLIVTAIITTFLLLSFLPAPKNVEDMVLTSEHEHGALFRLFTFITYFSSTPGRSLATVAFFFGLCVISAFAALHRGLGDVSPGTSLLWPDSRYNQAIAQINSNFAGSDVLQVVLESKRSYGLESAPGLNTMARFEHYMQEDPAVGGTYSFADMVPGMDSLLNGGLPKWRVIPANSHDAAAVARLAMTGHEPSDFDPWVTPMFTAANVSVWYKDHRGKTIADALERAQSFADSHRAALAGEGFRIRVASGEMGLLGAINRTIAPYEIITVILISLVIFTITAFIYRSLTAGILLLVISNMAYLLTCAVMYLKGIGLNVDTFPVAAVGIGIGIDYNIYLMSRMCDEYLINPDYSSLIPASIFTTGKAIFFTATTMVVGVGIWYFISDLRFQAEMGLLLAAVMIAHVVLALFFQAAMMQIIRPQFIRKGLIIHGRGGQALAQQGSA